MFDVSENGSAEGRAHLRRPGQGTFRTAPQNQPGALAEYGLDPPRYALSLQRCGQTVLAASFGARNPQNVFQYVRVAGRDELYLLPVFVGREWELVAEGVQPEVTRRAGGGRAPPTLLVWIAAVGLVVTCLSVVPPAPLAHVGGSTGYASIVVSGNTVRYSLMLSASALPPAGAEEVARVRAGRPDSRDRLLGQLRDKLALVDQGRRCEPAQGFVDAGGAEADRVTLVMDFACASDVRELSIRDDLFDVLGPDHHTLAKIESGDGGIG